MFKDFNEFALNYGEIDEDFMEAWYIDLDEDELDTWKEAEDSNDPEFLEMLTEDFNDSVVDKFFDLCAERDIFPTENCLDEDCAISDDYRTLVTELYNSYFKS
jgi:hypothetical protein